uniref:Uncharacterized protein LOC8273091 isoform X1 n=1 Tax=Rhizophora mucronata TaxID=61149 RepID=A0A2P2J859_RHIMU
MMWMVNLTMLLQMCLVTPALQMLQMLHFIRKLLSLPVEMCGLHKASRMLIMIQLQAMSMHLTGNCHSHINLVESKIPN